METVSHCYLEQFIGNIMRIQYP